MWLVPKIKLVISIVLVSLLTLVFLVVQVCLLESTCNRELSEVVVTHRRALYRVTGSLLDSESAVSDTLGGLGNTPGRPYLNTSLVYLPTASRNRVNKTVSDQGKALPDEKPSQILSSRTSEVPSLSPRYRVISKSSYAMLHFFQEQRSKLHNCKLPNCMDSLSDFDKACYDYCSRKQNRGKGEQSGAVQTPKGACRFMRGEGRAPVALASLPGSGNTWIRGLLEKATGICTGSVYCDVQLRGAGFNGEEIRSGSVLVVKTHKANFSWTGVTLPKFTEKGVPSYGAMILLLRNPYHALVAERNRKQSQKLKLKKTTAGTTVHTLSVGSEHFGINREWNSFVKTKMSKWKTYVESAILESPPNLPKLVVRYEDFQRDRVGEVSRVLDFLHFPHSRETLSQRLEEDFSTFHRKRHTEFEAFTQSQEQFMEHSLRQIVDRLSRENNGDTLGIEEYLRHLSPV